MNTKTPEIAKLESAIADFRKTRNETKNVLVKQTLTSKIDELESFIRTRTKLENDYDARDLKGKFVITPETAKELKGKFIIII